MLLKVVGVARLTRDVELKYLANNSSVAKLGLACSSKFKTQSGDSREDVCFIDGSVFGRLSEVANQYLRKGSKIYIDADLKFEQWVDQQGQNRNKHTLKINSFEMLDSKGGSQDGYTPAANPQVERPGSGGSMNNHNQGNVKQNEYIPDIDISEDEILF